MGRLLFNKLFGKTKDTLQIKKSQTGDWMVKRNFSILYIGSREKCEMYMNQIKAA